MSKKNFKHKETGSWITVEVTDTDKDLVISYLFRIADAVEKMAFRHTELIDVNNQYKLWNDRLNQKCILLKRRVSAYKGIIKRLKTNY
jgi:hypothetical protein